MTSKAQQAANAKSNRNWVRTIVALSVVVVLALSGVVVYGSAVLPAQNKAKDVAACKTFVVGYHNAQLAFIKEATAKDHTPSPKTAVMNYIEVLHTAANEGFKQSNQDGTIAKGFEQISIDYLTIDTKSETGLQNGFSTMDGHASTIEGLCNTAFDNAGVKSPVKTASPSPSATN
jgi:hypothetical protein